MNWIVLLPSMRRRQMAAAKAKNKLSSRCINISAAAEILPIALDRVSYRNASPVEALFCCHIFL